MRKYSQMLASFLFVCIAQSAQAIGELSPGFDQCENSIRQAHKDNVISYAEQQNLLATVHELKARDDRFLAEHNPPISGGVRERMYVHDPSVMKEIQAINARVGFRPMLQVTPSALPGHVVLRAWPPRDASGNIIMGPRTSGTAEQMGWPLYGWSSEDRRKYVMQK
jgi:hypothetical protein